MLHHGTVLFSSEMKDVSGALKISPLKYKDRAVKSIPKRVTNVEEHLKEKISLEEFTHKVMDHIIATHDDCKLYEFSEADLKAIQQLRDEKYATWDWNFGHSPNYNFRQGVKTKGGVLEINLEVKKGKILEAKIFGDFFGVKDVKEIEAALIDMPHEQDQIRAKLSQFDIDAYFHQITMDDLMSGLF